MNEQREAGFTVVELLIATLVFSLILVGSMAALIQMGRLYQNGVITARTQEVNRNAIAEISQSIQFSKRDVRPPSLTPPMVNLAIAPPDDSAVIGFFCVGPSRYTYALDRQLVTDSPVAAEKQKRRVLWLDSPDTGCANNPSVGPANIDDPDPCDVTDCGEGRELLSENMRISKLVIDDSATSGLWHIELSIAHGDDDLLEPVNNRYQCTGSLIGREYCAISELSTTILRRLNAS